jgi:hypothetical protein
MTNVSNAPMLVNGSLLSNESSWLGADAPLDLAVVCKALPSWGLAVGVLMGVAGSVGINIGQNIQAMSMQKLDEKGLARPWTSRGWRIGMWLFIIFSIINFAALAFAPASILTPIESIQFVTNVAFNRIVNKTKVSRRMLAGVGLSIIGTCLSVVCGPPGDSCHTVKQLTEFWSANPTWWFYLALTGGLAVGSYVYHERAMKARKAESLANDGIEGKPSIWLPLSFTLFSALAGGAQMIVHSKVFSELLAALFQGNYSMLLTWLFYIEVILVVSCGILWAFKLTECLGLYDPLVILPLMVGTFILFGGVAGGIFFREFERLHEGLAGPAGWPLYIIGMILVIWGLALIASDSPDQSDTVRNDIDNDTLKLEEVQEVVRDELGRLRYSTRKDSTGWQVIRDAMRPTDHWDIGLNPEHSRMAQRSYAPGDGHDLPPPAYEEENLPGGHRRTPSDPNAAGFAAARHRRTPSDPAKAKNVLFPFSSSRDALGASRESSARERSPEEERRWQLQRQASQAILKDNRRQALKQQRVLHRAASSAQLPAPFAMQRAGSKLPRLRESMREALHQADTSSEKLRRIVHSTGASMQAHVNHGVSGMGQAVQLTSTNAQEAARGGLGALLRFVGGGEAPTTAPAPATAAPSWASLPETDHGMSA